MKSYDDDYVSEERPRRAAAPRAKTSAEGGAPRRTVKRTAVRDEYDDYAPRAAKKSAPRSERGDTAPRTVRRTARDEYDDYAPRSASAPVKKKAAPRSDYDDYAPRRKAAPAAKRPSAAPARGVSAGRAKSRKKPRGRKNQFTLTTLLIWVVAAAAAFAIGAYLRANVFDVVRMSSDAMYASIDKGEVVIVTKNDYAGGDPARGDVAAIRVEGGVIIRRVVGEPGETVGVSDNETTIDGEMLPEGYVSLANYDTFDTLTLAADRYYVMGDNRAEVSDSRDERVGLVKKDQFVGKARYVIWPLNRIRAL